MKKNDVVMLVDDSEVDEELQILINDAEEHGVVVERVPHELFLLYTDILSRPDETATDDEEKDE